jgi:ELWxxDGT repeat protein
MIHSMFARAFQRGCLIYAILFISVPPNSLRAEADIDIISLGNLNTQAVTTRAVGPGAGFGWFASSDSEHGTEVWIYSGSSAFLFRDTRPGPESSNPLNLQPSAATSSMLLTTGFMVPSCLRQPKSVCPGCWLMFNQGHRMPPRRSSVPAMGGFGSPRPPPARTPRSIRPRNYG